MQHRGRQRTEEPASLSSLPKSCNLVFVDKHLLRTSFPLPPKDTKSPAAIDCVSNPEPQLRGPRVTHSGCEAACAGRKAAWTTLDVQVGSRHCACGRVAAMAHIIVEPNQAWNINHRVTFYRPSATSPEVLPPLRLQHDDTPMHASAILRSLRSPFWLDVVLSYMRPDDWVVGELVCWALAGAMRRADAWTTVNLGPFVVPSGEAKRREVIERRAARIRVRKAWEQIRRYASAGWAWTLNPGLRENEVRRLERELGRALPAEVRAWFMEANGQAYNCGGDPGICGGRLLTLHEIARESSRWSRGASHTPFLPLRRTRTHMPQELDINPHPHTHATSRSQSVTNTPLNLPSPAEAHTRGMLNAPSQPTAAMPWPPTCRSGAAVRTSSSSSLWPLRMVPLSEGFKGSQVCVAMRMPKYASADTPAHDLGGARASHVDDASVAHLQGSEADVLESAIYLVSALHRRKLADSWGQYLGTLR